MEGLTRGQRTLLAGVAASTVGAGILRYVGAPHLVAFAVATLALAGLAWVVSFATEEVGHRFGPAATGVMQATLGNLPEFFVVIFALNAGQITVAQTSILGSILANALLVLGLAIVVGARQASDGIMRFSTRLPNDTATLLLLASFIIVLVGLSVGSGDPASHHVKAVSTIASVVLLLVYVSWVVPYVRSETRKAKASERSASEKAAMSFRPAVALLVLGGLGAAFVSDWFIHALEPTIEQLNLSQAFAGFVIVAIAGNAVEHVTGIILARKGQADLSISVIKNSVAQVAAFLFPALVLVSLLFSPSLTYQMRPVYIGALLGTALAIYQVTSDGEATQFEGWALVGSFVVLGVVTLYE
jgi:Ca2+:H+ antiporter